MEPLPITLAVLAMLVASAFVAGWVDAVVGGGGLIQLPALLIGLPTETPTPSVLGTNKVSSAAGTLIAAATYARRVTFQWRTLVVLIACSGAGAATGAALARLIPKTALTPIVLVALVAVGLYTWFRPQVGLSHEPRFTGAGEAARIGAIGLAVGVYDGILGPGTGSFFIIAMVALLGYGFLEASAQAKIANLTTNIAALAVFGVHGEVLWLVGGAMAVGNVAGGLVGATMAIRRGSRFVRRVFLLVVGVLIVRLAWDTATMLF